MISSILEWVQCFSISISVITLKEHQWTPDLLSYMNLIIEAHLEYSGDAWQVYGQRFRQEWLWLQKWNGLQQIPHYGILHLQATPMPKDANTASAHDSCDWTPEPATTSFRCRPTPQPLLTSTHRCHICLTWNNTPSPDCSFSGSNMNISAVFVQNYQLLPI